jgi:hypothetical protein
VRTTDGSSDEAADETEEEQVEAGEAGTTEDAQATDAEYTEEDAPIGDILTADEE